jgi:hypothetical protein
MLVEKDFSQLCHDGFTKNPPHHFTGEELGILLGTH